MQRLFKFDCASFDTLEVTFIPIILKYIVALSKRSTIQGAVFNQVNMVCTL